MKPVVDIVDQLLTAGVNVTVYNGQLDLIVDTMGNSLDLLLYPLQWLKHQACLVSSHLSAVVPSSSSSHRSGAVGKAAEVGRAFCF